MAICGTTSLGPTKPVDLAAKRFLGEGVDGEAVWWTGEGDDAITDRVGEFKRDSAIELLLAGHAGGGLRPALLGRFRSGLSLGLRYWLPRLGLGWLARLRFDVIPGVGLWGADTGISSTIANAAALAWLDEHQGEPFFLYVHVMDTHQPYTPPAELECSLVQADWPGDDQRWRLARAPSTGRRPGGLSPLEGYDVV